MQQINFKNSSLVQQFLTKTVIVLMRILFYKNIKAMNDKMARMGEELVK